MVKTSGGLDAVIRAYCPSPRGRLCIPLHIMPIPNKSNIWVPPSYSDRAIGAVQKVVRDYDPDLDFGRNEETGQWCIFLKRGTKEMAKEFDLPILGFNDIPHPDDALRRLHQSDALRTGNEIIDRLQRHNESIESKREEAASDAVAETAEAFDWGFRQMGKAPHAKIFIPGR